MMFVTMHECLLRFTDWQVRCCSALRYYMDTHSFQVSEAFLQIRFGPRCVVEHVTMQASERISMTEQALVRLLSRC